MKHNLTAEQVAYATVIWGLFVWFVYLAIEHLKEKYYKKGYIHGYNRAKAIHRQGDTR
jgi:hypothetical protein